MHHNQKQVDQRRNLSPTIALRQRGLLLYSNMYLYRQSWCDPSGACPGTRKLHSGWNFSAARVTIPTGLDDRLQHDIHWTVLRQHLPSLPDNACAPGLSQGAYITSAGRNNEVQQTAASTNTCGADKANSCQDLHNSPTNPTLVANSLYLVHNHHQLAENSKLPTTELMHRPAASGCTQVATVDAERH